MESDEVRVLHSIVHFGMKLLEKYLKEKIEESRMHADDPKEVHPDFHKENLALLEREYLHISQTVDYIRKIDLSRFNTPAEYKAHLLTSIQRYYQEQEIPQACFVIISDKVERCWDFYLGLSKG